MTKKYMDFAPKSRSRTAAAPVRKTVTAGRAVASGKVATTGRRVAASGARAATPGAASKKVGAPRVVRTTTTKTAVKKSATVTGAARTNVGAAKSTTGVTRASAGVARATTGVAKPTVRVAAKPSARVIRSATVSSGASIKKPTGVKLGEIEDVNPKFVMTNVPKRALGSKPATTTMATATTAKAQKVGNRAKVSRKADTTDRMKLANEKKKTYMMPRVPFINQDKVAKRPLSKNVYKKQLDALEKATEGVNGVSKAGGPVTIISKPEKDSKVGVVVTIVLTIILGAVAGTVAFLLLPK